MAGDIQRRVRVVMEVDGVEQAAEDQLGLEAACERAGRALGEQAEAVGQVEESMASLSDVATHSEQVTQRLHQQMQAFAGGLGQVAAMLGTEGEAGALLGRMSHFASAGIQLGSIFGPAGAVVGGLVGSVVPALDTLIDRLDGTDTAAQRATDQVTEMAGALRDQATAAHSAAEGLNRWSQAAAARASTQRGERIRRGQYESEADVRLGAERLRELGGDEGSTANEIFGAMAEDLDAMADAISTGLVGDAGPTAGRTRRGGRGSGGSARRGPSAGDRLMALAAGRGGGGDAVSFAAGLGGESDPSAADVEGARGRGRSRMLGAFDAQRGAEQRAQLAVIEEIKDKQQQVHDAQMERIEQQVSAWTEAGQKIGGTIYDAFQIAATGQESLDVALVKGFKNEAIQFGGKMVNEGLGALLTAAGNAVANPPVATTKAIEGAGKIALGVGLGAVGAAIPVPSSGGSSPAKPPRLGPEANDGRGGGGSTVVNMNAPSVVTGSGAQVGRLIGRSLDDARQRFGRAA